MKKIIINTLILFVLTFTAAFPALASPNLKDAFSTESVDNGDKPALAEVSTKAGYDNSTSLNSMIGTIILTALSLLGIIFLILLIYAGYLWMTATGNEQQVEKAKSMITTSIIGLIIILSAYSISYFVISSLQDGALQEIDQE